MLGVDLCPSFFYSFFGSVSTRTNMEERFSPYELCMAVEDGI